MYFAAKEIIGKKKSEKKRILGRTKMQKNTYPSAVVLVYPVVLRVAIDVRVGLIPHTIFI